MSYDILFKRKEWMTHGHVFFFFGQVREREREREREYCPVRKCSRLARSISPVRGGAT
jgi:hypothetical protein